MVPLRIENDVNPESVMPLSSDQIPFIKEWLSQPNQGIRIDMRFGKFHHVQPRAPFYLSYSHICQLLQFLFTPTLATAGIQTILAAQPSCFSSERSCTLMP